MKPYAKVLIVAALVAAVGGVMALKGGSAAPAEAGDVSNAPAGNEQAASLPRLVDLGSETCIPCRMMKPILDELKQEYASQFVTEFIDVRKNPAAASEYQIRTIPTQVFLDMSGEELFRHVGFMSKEDILGKWQELGILTAAE